MMRLSHYLAVRLIEWNLVWLNPLGNCFCKHFGNIIKAIAFDLISNSFTPIHVSNLRSI